MFRVLLFIAGGICSMGLKLSSRSRVAAKMSSLREPKVTGAEIATIGW